MSYHKKKYYYILLLILSLTLIFNLSPVKADSPPNFAIPVDCNLDSDCFILLYVDLDPTSDAVDFNCGRQTYDTHTGTDFGISDLKVMERGIPVTAAADGKVLRVRDGIPDKLVENEEDKAAVEGVECGNGLVIAHGDGWETQYCHLRHRSITVKPGAQVKKGTVVGMVGASGLASFPHVHLTIRYQNRVVDPFVGVNSNSGCNVDRHPLWEENLQYKSTGLIRAGFASKPPEQIELWQGKFTQTKIPEDSPAVIFWVHTYGVLKGDVEYFQLKADNEEIVIEQENIIKNSYRSWVSFVGKRNLQRGVWQGKYQLKRDGSTLVEVQRQVQVKANTNAI